jgi:hypothetical protein
MIGKALGYLAAGVQFGFWFCILAVCFFIFFNYATQPVPKDEEVGFWMGMRFMIVTVGWLYAIAIIVTSMIMDLAGL